MKRFSMKRLNDTTVLLQTKLISSKN